MLETYSIGSLVDTARTYLAFRAGEAQLGAVDTCILILALSGALAAALNLWRIARREDFQERLDALRGTTLTRAEPMRPQLPPWYHRLGTTIAATPIIGTTEQRALLSALAAAGIRGHGRLASLLAAKGCSAVAFLMAGWLLDRFDRRRVMIADSVLRAAIFLLIPLLNAAGLLAVWHVYAVAAVYGPLIWLVMSLVVIPAFSHRPPTINFRWWMQFVGHFPFVGLPIVAMIGRA